MTCPLQAHFHYDLHLPDTHNAKATFGNCIHHALDIYNTTQNLDLAIETFKKVWYDPSPLGINEHGVWPRNTSYGSLRERGILVLQEFHERCKWDQRTVVGTEHKFLVPFGEHELTGAVDLIELRKSGNGKELLKIVDYKSSSYKPSKFDLLLDIQFTIYLYASMQKEFWVGNGPEYAGLPNGEWQFETLKDQPRRAIWYHLWTQQEIDAGGRTEEDFQRLYRLCCEVQRATEAEVFVPRIGEACTFCAYHEWCNIKIPTEDELRNQDEAWI